MGSQGPKASSQLAFFYKSIAGRYRPVRVAYGPITDRYIFIKNANWVQANYEYSDQPVPMRRLI